MARPRAYRISGASTILSHRRTVSEGLPGSSRLILASRASLDIVRMPDAFGQYSRYARAPIALARPVEACNDADKNSGRLRQCPALETISCSAPLQCIQQTVNALINTLGSAVVDQCTCASIRSGNQISQNIPVIFSVCSSAGQIIPKENGSPGEGASGEAWMGGATPGESSKALCFLIRPSRNPFHMPRRKATGDGRVFRGMYLTALRIAKDISKPAA